MAAPAPVAARVVAGHLADETTDPVDVVEMTDPAVAAVMTDQVDVAVMTDRVAGEVAMTVLVEVPTAGGAAAMVDVTIEADVPAAAADAQAAEGPVAAAGPVIAATSSHRSGGPTRVRSPMHNAAPQRSMLVGVRRV